MKRAFVLVAACGGVVSVASAQVINWNTGTGNWNSAGNWNPMNVPDNAAEDAVIGIPGTYTVTLNLAPTIRSLDVSNRSATLDIPTGVNLAIASADGVLNDGLIRVNSTAGGAATFIQWNVNGPLGGTGVVRLNASPNLDTAYLQTNGTTFTQASTHTIAGTGRIFGSLANNGLVVADQAGKTLELLSASKSNSGVLSAINGGILRISGIALTQSGGSITADASDVSLVNTSITGGTVNAVNGGLTTIGGTVTFANVDCTGPIAIPTGNTLVASGSGLTSTGTVTVNTTAGGAATLIHFNDSGLFDGGGTILLNASPNLDTAYVQTAGGVTVTNAPANTIRGSGRVFGSLINNGLVHADAANKVLELLSSNKTNNNLCRATGGAVLRISGIVVNQGAAGKIEADASTLALVNSIINGGQINATSGAVTTISGTCTLNDTTLVSGPVDIPTGNALVITGAGLNHSGVVTINTTAGGAATFIQFNQSGAFSGNGTVLLNASPNLDTAYLQTGGGATITNAAGHTIRGSGRVHGTLVNNGLIHADTAGKTLQLLSTNKTNNSQINATGGATLSVSGITLTQAPAASIAADGSGVSLVNAAIIGGHVNAVNGGVTTLGGTVTFNGVTTSGPVELPTGNVLVLAGNACTNNGSILVNTTAGGAATFIQFSTGFTLGGTGTVTLNASPNPDTAYSSGNGVTATYGPGQTLRGRGRLYGPHIIQGTIEPGLSAGRIQAISTLAFEGTSKMKIQLGGTSQGSTYDHIQVTSAATIDGAIEVSYIDGFLPASKDFFDILTAGSVSGSFDSITVPIGPMGAPLRVHVLSDRVRVSACYSDCDGSGELDIDDFLCFQSEFAFGSDFADCDNSGELDIDDFICFQTLFGFGCP